MKKKNDFFLKLEFVGFDWWGFMIVLNTLEIKEKKEMNCFESL